jgi:hypothetical protein
MPLQERCCVQTICVNIHPLTVWNVAPGHIRNVAPRLPRSKLYFIRDMIQSQSLNTSQIAEQANAASVRSKIFAETYANLETYMLPSNRVGRRRTITPRMLEV